MLGETAVFQYKCDNFYAPQSDAGVQLNDESLGIGWKVPMSEACLSVKDYAHPLLRNAVLDFDIHDKLY